MSEKCNAQRWWTFLASPEIFPGFYGIGDFPGIFPAVVRYVMYQTYYAPQIGHEWIFASRGTSFIFLSSSNSLPAAL